jgi:hypothetical protein
MKWSNVMSDERDGNQNLADSGNVTVKAGTELVDGLSAREALAMRVIVSGGTVVSAAKAAEVTRKTFYRWMTPGHRFEVALRCWRRELAQTARDRLLAMMGKATLNVWESLRKGDARTSMRLLEKLGVLAAPATGPTETELRQAVREQKIAREAKRKRRESEAEDFIGPLGGGGER